MVSYEYVVVPAPRRAPKVKGVKGGEALFAHALTEVMNAYGAEGWDYVRSDLLACDERSGLMGTKTVEHRMLVFRREIEAPAAEMPAPAPRDSAAAPAVKAGEPGRKTPSLGAADRKAPVANAGEVRPFPLSVTERSKD